MKFLVAILFCTFLATASTACMSLTLYFLDKRHALRAERQRERDRLKGALSA